MSPLNRLSCTHSSRWLGAPLRADLTGRGAWSLPAFKRWEESKGWGVGVEGSKGSGGSGGAGKVKGRGFLNLHWDSRWLREAATRLFPLVLVCPLSPWVGVGGQAGPPEGARELQRRKGTHLGHAYAPDVVSDLRGGQFP